MSTLKVKKFTPHLYEKYQLYHGSELIKIFSSYREVVKFLMKNKKGTFQIKGVSMTKLHPQLETLIERS